MVNRHLTLLQREMIAAPVGSGQSLRELAGTLARATNMSSRKLRGKRQRIGYDSLQLWQRQYRPPESALSLQNSLWNRGLQVRSLPGGLNLRRFEIPCVPTLMWVSG